MARSYKKRVLTHPELSSLPPSMPLIIPNDCEYDVSTNELRPIPGERRSSLKIVPETLRLLENIERPVAVVAICGPCRTGKSYILSRMLGSADAFDLGHTMDPKTFGIWIGTTVLDCDEFTLLLIDTEGIDAVSATTKDDASVLVMTALLSSCLIYNSLGVPKHNDLQKMSHFAHLATSIVVKEVQGDSEEDDSFELKNHFPDFVWLLRDVTLVPTGEDGKEIPPTEYLMTKVFRRSKSFKESQSDQIGRAILTVFPTIECRTIQPPSSDPTVMRNIATQQDSLDPRFNDQVQELVEYLLHCVRGKKGILSGKMADGLILAAMTTHYLEAINNPDAIPCISDTWQAAIEARCRKVMEQLLMEYEEELQAKVKEVGLPMEEDSPNNSDLDKPRTLLALHRSILLEKSKALLKQVGHFVSGSATSGSGLSKESLSTELELGAATFTEEPTGHEVGGEQVMRKRVTGGILFKYAQENYKASRSRCTRRFEELYAAIEEKMKQPRYSFDDLMKDLERLQIKYYQEAVGPAKWEVYEEKRAFIKSQEKSYKALQGFKKKAFDAQQQAADAGAEAAKLQDSLQTLQTQMKEDAEMGKRKMEQQEADHKEEMEKFRKEELQRIENERQKSEAFMKAQMQGMADMAKANSETMKEQFVMMQKVMENASAQNGDCMKALTESNEKFVKAIMNQPKPDTGGCFAAGTKVTCTDGSELAIEKQAMGTKVLAIGGETTTITDEYVEERLEAGQQLFGINDDAPFAALHHPFWTTEGWKCLNPELAKEENPNMDFKLLQIGDVVFRIAQTHPLLYEPVKIRQFTFTTLSEPIKIYGLHLDGPRSYHANGYVVAANYPVLTKKRVREGMKTLSEEERERLTSAMTAAQSELTKVLGSWANSAFKDMGLVAKDETMDD